MIRMTAKQHADLTDDLAIARIQRHSYHRQEHVAKAVPSRTFAPPTTTVTKLSTTNVAPIGDQRHRRA